MNIRSGFFRRVFFEFGILAFSVILLTSCNRKPDQEIQQPYINVAATIFPLADIAKQVGGERVHVITLLQPGADPHTFSLSPKELKVLEKCQLSFEIGLNFDEWLSKAHQNVQSPPLNLSQLIKAPENSGLDELRAGENPHYWLSGTYAMEIAKVMAESFIRIDPGHLEIYQKNLENYLEKLKIMNDEIHKILNGMETKKVITFHPAWAYFAEEYHLNVAGSIESGVGETPKHLAKLNEFYREKNMKVLFVETEVPATEAKFFAEDYGLKVLFLDPLGGVPGRDSYINMMLYNARTFKEGLSYE